MIFKWCRQLLVHFLHSIVNMFLLLCELLFKFTHYLFQSFQLILHASIDSWRSDTLMHQLFYHLCQSFHLFSEYQFIVSTFVELIKYSQLVQFLMYVLRLDWILLQDNDTHLSLICWHYIDNAHHLSLMIRMKRKHHVNNVLLLKEKNYSYLNSEYVSQSFFKRW